MKRNGPDHPKTKRLVSLLHIPIYSAVGLLEMLFHFASRHAPRGDVGRYSDSEIAEAVGWHGDGTRLVGAMHRAGYLDADPEYRWVIHDWPDHADEAVKKLLKRRGLTFIVSRQSTDMSGKCPDVSRLPLPLPLPLREPLPEPLPLPAETNPLPCRFELDAIADIGIAIHQRHPRHRRGTQDETVRALLLRLNGGNDQLAMAQGINRRHQGWCASEEWRNKGGQYAPGITRWLGNGGCMTEPPEESDDDDWMRDIIAREKAEQASKGKQ